MNLAEIVSESAARTPQAVAIKLDEFELNYAVLEQGAMRVAGMLERWGVEPGDRVALMVPNIPQFALLYYGILRAGAVVVPLNVLSSRREVEFFMRDSGAGLLFVFELFEQVGRGGAEDAGAGTIIVDRERFAQAVLGSEPRTEIVQRAGEDTAVMLYTSGTTGTPKGAELTHLNLLGNCQVCRDMFDMPAGTVLLGALPLFHAFGQTSALNACMLGGQTLTLLPRFDGAQALQIIERDRVMLFQGVPSMYGAMLNAPGRDRYDASSLELCVSGGSAMPVELLHEFERAFGCTILEGYGLSETSPVASFNHPDRPSKVGSIGTPIDGVEMRIVDEHDDELPVGDVGEIVIRGGNVMKGYWRRPEATTEAMRGGWFHTGDLARVDDDGYFFIVDRKKDLIIRNGFNVYPREVEEILYAHPAVREAAVVAVPDGVVGEEVGAAVVLKDGATASTDELREFVKEQVAAFKYPRRVWIVDDLPIGPTGKILKREIEIPAAAQSPAAESSAAES